MKLKKFIRLIIVTFISVLYLQHGIACSGYKITLGDRTFFGSNEDAWRLTPRIWFENKTVNWKYGSVFTGSRFDGDNGYTPQSGMNEMGLAFERLASYYPKSEQISGKKTINNPTQFLKDILHSCKTVEEVKEFYNKYDHSYFIDDVFIYVDKSGKYLIVEPYNLTIGNKPAYVISNFCPSITTEQKANQFNRYRKGVAFLSNKIDTTLEFCKSLSDTMHVCRNKIGDGTLLTSVWDLNKGTVNLYFYHQYKNTVQFNLNEELEKGDHSIAIETLFPVNPEFEKLANYKTPKNSTLIGVLIVGSAGLFLFTSIFFLIKYFRRRSNEEYSYIQLILFPLGIILFYYMYVLISNINIFYFSSPYKDPTNIFVSLTSYIPFLLLLIIIPFSIINYRLFKTKIWGVFSKGLFTLNNIVFIILIGLFVYWGFYNFSS